MDEEEGLKHINFAWVVAGVLSDFRHPISATDSTTESIPSTPPTSTRMATLNGLLERLSNSITFHGRRLSSRAKSAVSLPTDIGCLTKRRQLGLLPCQERRRRFRSIWGGRYGIREPARSLPQGMLFLVGDLDRWLTRICRISTYFRRSKTVWNALVLVTFSSSNATGMSRYGDASWVGS